MVMLTEAAVATALGVAGVAVVVVGVAVAALVGTNCSTSSRGRNGVNLALTGLLDYFLPLAPQLFADQMGPRCYLGRLRRQVDRFNGWGVAKSCEATWYTHCRHWQITCYKVSPSKYTWRFTVQKPKQDCMDHIRILDRYTPISKTPSADKSAAPCYC